MKKRNVVLILLLLISFQSKAQTTNESSVKEKRSKIIIMTSLGRSYRLARTADNIDPFFKNYVEDLKSGISFDLSGYYLLPNSSGIGLGLKYSRYNSKESLANVLVTYKDGSSESGTISDDITISFFGPSMVLDKHNPNAIGDFNLEIALGYMGYTDNSYNPKSLQIKGSTFGIALGAGYHFKLTKDVYFGPQISFVSGVLNKLEITRSNGSVEIINLTDGEREGLLRIDLSACLKIRL